MLFRSVGSLAELRLTNPGALNKINYLFHTLPYLKCFIFDFGIVVLGIALFQSKSKYLCSSANSVDFFSFDFRMSAVLGTMFFQSKISMAKIKKAELPRPFIVVSVRISVS